MMEIDMDKRHWDNNGCPKYDCRKAACKCGLKYVNLPAALGDDSRGSSVAPQNGVYCNAIVEYMANGHIYIYSSEGVPTLVETDVANLEKTLEKEIADRGRADDALQQEIDNLKNSPDVVDIVPTYAALQAYDTSKLGDNDIIRVLADETHDGQSTYYRWDASTSSWTYIGAVGDYYTKSQVDTLLGGKQNTLTAGANITIVGDTISASAGASIIYLEYSPGTEPDPNDIKLYADATLATELTGGDFWDILASGKPVMLRSNDISEDEIQTFSFVYSRLPSEKTILGFDNYPPEAYFYSPPNGIVYINFVAGDPDVAGGFAISIQDN